MFRTTFIALLLLAGCGQPWPLAQHNPPAASATPPSIQDSVVRIAAQTEKAISTGTGFVVGPNLVLTNAHVISDAIASDIYVWDHGSEFATRPFAVIRRDPHLDLALIYVAGLKAPPVRFALSEPSQLSTVTAIGYPYSTDMMFGRLTVKASLTEGKVTAADLGTVGSVGHLRLLNHTATVNPGNSGGPLLNACGAVVGVNTMRAKPSEASNVSIATTTLEAIPFLIALGVTPQIDESVCRQSEPKPCSSDIEAALDLLQKAKFYEAEDYLTSRQSLCRTASENLLKEFSQSIRTLARIQSEIAGRWKPPGGDCDNPLAIIGSGLSILAVSPDDSQFEAITMIDGNTIHTKTDRDDGEISEFAYSATSERLTLENTTSNQKWELDRCSH